MSSVASCTAQSIDRPERSRNAKAQARHRAKRKAYIEQLEQTVTKLQAILGLSDEQIATLPAPLIKIRELEEANARLQIENEHLRRMLSASGGRLSLDMPRRDLSFQDTRDICDREYKKRKLSGGTDNSSISPIPHNAHEPVSRPLPLNAPQTLPHPYGKVSHNIPPPHQNGTTGSPLFGLPGPTFQIPMTPPRSSATSSPPFSPTQMAQHPSHPNHYGSVKAEDEHYMHHHHHDSHRNHAAAHYSNTLPPPYGNTPAENDLGNWHLYSSERARGPLPR